MIKAAVQHNAKNIDPEAESLLLFSDRMGSRKKNWDLYPSCLREMARVCRPGSGKAVLLTQDKKCFSKVMTVIIAKSRMDKKTSYGNF